MIIETERLILRPWIDSDASDLYDYARDPDVASPAGWPVHDSVEMSRMVIHDVFSAPETYAVVLKATQRAVGCCGMVPEGARDSCKTNAFSEAEIGYWIGKPFWGRGLIPEAVEALIGHLCADLGKRTFWIGLYDGNYRSLRVAEKCGFVWHHTEHRDDLSEHFFKRAVI